MSKTHVGETLDYIRCHCTRKNVLRCKLGVLGLAGLKTFALPFIAGKLLLAKGVLAATLSLPIIAQASVTPEQVEPTPHEVAQIQEEVTQPEPVVEEVVEEVTQPDFPEPLPAKEIKAEDYESGDGYAEGAMELIILPPAE